MRNNGHAKAAQILQGRSVGLYISSAFRVRSDYWMGKSAKSARREIFYYDETDLMAIRVDGWKMHIGVKPEGIRWNQKYYPSVPYLFVQPADGSDGENGSGIA
jgi:hypothetical protein